MAARPRSTRGKGSGLLGLLLVLLAGNAMANGGAEMKEDLRTVIDLSESPTEPAWTAVNDDVMGGVSTGRVDTGEGALRFQGELSLANNGGFASVRTRGWSVDLSDTSALWLRVRGDGRTWQLRLSTDARYRWSWVSYSQSFRTEADRWIDVRLPLSEFTPTYRGRTLDGPRLDASHVRELGLLLGDQQEAPFSIELQWVKAEASTGER